MPVPILGSLRHLTNTKEQRAAMEKLDFLVGTWSGEVRMAGLLKGLLPFRFSEKISYRMNGLLMDTETTLLSQPDLAPAIQLLNLVNFDVWQQEYKIKLFFEGRFTESTVTVEENSFVLDALVGPFQIHARKRLVNGCLELSADISGLRMISLEGTFQKID